MYFTEGFGHLQKGERYVWSNTCTEYYPECYIVLRDIDIWDIVPDDGCVGGARNAGTDGGLTSP